MRARAHLLAGGVVLLQLVGHRGVDLPRVAAERGRADGGGVRRRRAAEQCHMSLRRSGAAWAQAGLAASGTHAGAAMRAAADALRVRVRAHLAEHVVRERAQKVRGGRLAVCGAMRRGDHADGKAELAVGAAAAAADGVAELLLGAQAVEERFVPGDGRGPVGWVRGRRGWGPGFGAGSGRAALAGGDAALPAGGARAWKPQQPRRAAPTRPLDRSAQNGAAPRRAQAHPRGFAQTGAAPRRAHMRASRRESLAPSCALHAPSCQ